MRIEDFIEQRLAEDRTMALAASIEYEFEEWTACENSVDTITTSNVAHPVQETYRDDVAAHIARQDPARVLRQCTALRSVLGAYEIAGNSAGYAEMTADAWVLLRDDAIRPIAAIWSDHPDYQQEWGA